jgi:imidazole glycerol phosphate synthase subunit HisF
MRYNINDKVVVISDNKVKTISDSEIILGVEIYYMSDNTSYSSFELEKKFKYYNNNELVLNIINSDGLNEIIDSKIDKFVDNVVLWYQKFEEPKIEKKNK